MARPAAVGEGTGSLRIRRAQARRLPVDAGARGWQADHSIGERSPGPERSGGPGVSWNLDPAQHPRDHRFSQGDVRLADQARSTCRGRRRGRTNYYRKRELPFNQCAANEEIEPSLPNAARRTIGQNVREAVVRRRSEFEILRHQMPTLRRATWKGFGSGKYNDSPARCEGLSGPFWRKPEVRCKNKRSFHDLGSLRR